MILLLLLAIADVSIASYRYSVLAHATNQAARDIAAELGTPTSVVSTPGQDPTYTFQSHTSVESKVNNEFDKYAPRADATLVNFEIISVHGSPFCVLRVLVEEPIKCALCSIFYTKDSNQIPQVELQASAPIESTVYPCPITGE